MFNTLTLLVGCRSLAHFVMVYNSVRSVFSSGFVLFFVVYFCQELEKILTDTPPVWRGSSKLFRNLRERGQRVKHIHSLIQMPTHANFKVL